MKYVTNKSLYCPLHAHKISSEVYCKNLKSDFTMNPCGIHKGFSGKEFEMNSSSKI